MPSFSKLLRSYKVSKMKRNQFFKSWAMNLEKSIPRYPFLYIFSYDVLFEHFKIYSSSDL